MGKERQLYIHEIRSSPKSQKEKKKCNKDRVKNKKKTKNKAFPMSQEKERKKRCPINKEGITVMNLHEEKKKEKKKQ